MLVDVKVPVLAESVAEATLLTWQKRVGDKVKRGENLINIETDKVTLEVAALNDGVVTEIIKNDGETVLGDEVIARIDTAAAADKKAAGTKTQAAAPVQQPLPDMNPKTSAPAEKDRPKLSPAVRNMLEENNLKAGDIATGSDRITKEDVIRHIKGATDTEKIPASAVTKPQPKQATPKTEVAGNVGHTDVTATAPVLDSSAGKRPEEKVPMTRLRKRAAERLLAAQQKNAILTTFNEVSMKPVMDIRHRFKTEFEKTHGIKLGFMSFFTRAAVEALKKFPVINASVDGDNINYHGYFDMGIAVSSPRGLVVPIIRDVDVMSLAEIESQIRAMGEKAKDGKLTMDDLTGGTFTITNGGVFGSLLSTPIINPPQSAILGMHSIQERPVVENGEIVIRPMMYIALSYDHRIIDGREAVQFLIAIKAQLEDPARWLLQL